MALSLATATPRAFIGTGGSRLDTGLPGRSILDSVHVGSARVGLGASTRGPAAVAPLSPPSVTMPGSPDGQPTSPWESNVLPGIASGLTTAVGGGLGSAGKFLPTGIQDGLKANQGTGLSTGANFITGFGTSLAAGDNPYAQVGQQIGSLFGAEGAIVGTLAGGLVSSAVSPGRNNFEGSSAGITKMPGGRGGMLLAQQGVTLDDVNSYLSPAIAAYKTSKDINAAKAALGAPTNAKQSAIMKYWDLLSTGPQNIFDSIAGEE